MKPGATAVLFVVLAPALCAQLAGPPDPIPIELALSARSLSVYERPSLSADGRFVVYAVKEPLPAGREAGLEEGQRAFPGGTPVSGAGVRLFVTNTGDGTTRALSKPGANSIRPAFSPDGARIAYYCDEGGVLGLWIFDLATGAARRVGDASVKARLWAGDEPQWANLREVLVPLPGAPPGKAGEKITEKTNIQNGPGQAPKTSGPQIFISRKPDPREGAENPPKDTSVLDARLRAEAVTLAFVDTETGAVRRVVEANAELAPATARLSPSGRWIATYSIARVTGDTSTKFVHDLAVCDAATGKIAFIEKALDLDDAEYTTDTFRWRPGADELFFFAKQRLRSRDFSKSAVGDEKIHAFGLGETDSRFLVFTRDGTRVIFGLLPHGPAEDARLGVQVLISVELATGYVTALSYPAETRIVTLFRAQAATLWQPEAGHCAGVARDLTTGRNSIVQIDLESGALAAVRTGAFRASSVGSSDGHGALFIQYESSDSTGDIYQISGDLKTLKKTTQVEPALAALSLGVTETIVTTVAAPGGGTASVFTNIALPPGAAKPPRLPAIVHVYGGTRLSREAERAGAGSLSSLPASIFTTRGYAVLFVDSLMDPEGSAGNPIQNLKDVVVPQVLHAAELGYIDINRVAVTGQSYGGYCTAALLSSTELFKAGAAVSGVYDLPGSFAWMDAHGDDFHIRWSEGGQGRMGTHPWAELKRYIDNSPYYRADRIRAPLLLLHGERDDACPVSEARKMFQALKRLRQDCDLAIYPGEGHVISEWSLANARDAAERMLKFFGKELRGE
jgi:dipeptidyl aminopeptidase/acylaminoacyl peptidase